MRSTKRTRPERVSWVASAQGHGEFPLQNLPLGIFSRDGDAPRGSGLWRNASR